MVRGRATGRGTRRGAAASSSSGDASQETPATIATATPAIMVESTPPAPAPSPAPAAAPAKRGATTARATRGTTAAGRFRPKNIRRDETERDLLAQQEQQKASERAADERRARGRSRFRSKRSRGDTMGSRGGFGRPVTGASGPFSSALGGPGGGGPGGGWFGSAGGGGGGGGSFSRVGGKYEGKSGQGISWVSEGFRDSRINADKLHSMTREEDFDSEDEAMIATMQARTSVMPMGIFRKEHKEAAVIVATAAEMEAAENDDEGEEESLWVDGEGSGTLPPMDQPEEGTWDTDSKTVRVKKEPTDDDAMDLDIDVKPETKPVVDKGKQPAVKTKLKKAVAQDPEESMIRTDLSLLASELGAITINGDGESEEKDDAPASKDGRLYLFQFPPLLPPLKQVAMPQPRIKVKEEEPQSFSLHDTPVNPSNHATPVDLTQDGAQGDNNEEEESDEDDEEEDDHRHGFRSQALPSGGMIGKLNVRKSGKVELDWGGRILEMSPAAGMNFLTTAVIIEESDEKPQNGVTGGETIGMGKIMGRFVLAPIWSEEEEWDVAPEELVIG